MSYIDLIKEKAKADRKTIVLPETNDKRTLIAAARIMQEKIADLKELISCYKRGVLREHQDLDNK